MARTNCGWPTSLKALTAPNLAAGADVATIQEVASDEVESKGVIKLTLTTDRQLLRLTADFDVMLTPDDHSAGVDIGQFTRPR